jgi:hypothetical protein
MRNTSDENCRENYNTRIFLFTEVNTCDFIKMFMFITLQKPLEKTSFNVTPTCLLIRFLEIFINNLHLKQQLLLLSSQEHKTMNRNISL